MGHDQFMRVPTKPDNGLTILTQTRTRSRAFRRNEHGTRPASPRTHLPVAESPV